MSSFIDACKESAVEGMEHFLKVFSHVPDDKLHWSPSPTAKSAIRIAAHTAAYPSNFAKMIRERRLPVGDDLADFFAKTTAAEQALTSRDDIVAAFRRNTEEVLAALDTVTPDLLDLSLVSHQNWSLPMRFLVKIPGMHAFSHAAQIDYLQTCWDDQVVHVSSRED